MHAEPQPQHQWLQKLVGEWTAESECSMGPDQPVQKTKMTETVRPLGALWTLAEGQGEMPGGGMAKMLMTLGYNPQTGRFVGTWVGSMMTHMWVYDGEPTDPLDRTVAASFRRCGQVLEPDAAARVASLPQLASERV